MLYVTTVKAGTERNLTLHLRMMMSKLHLLLPIKLMHQISILRVLAAKRPLSLNPILGKGHVVLSTRFPKRELNRHLELSVPGVSLRKLT